MPCEIAIQLFWVPCEMRSKGFQIEIVKNTKNCTQGVTDRFQNRFLSVFCRFVVLWRAIHPLKRKEHCFQSTSHELWTVCFFIWIVKNIIFSELKGPWLKGNVSILIFLRTKYQTQVTRETLSEEFLKIVKKSLTFPSGNFVKFCV